MKKARHAGLLENRLLLVSFLGMTRTMRMKMNETTMMPVWADEAA